MYELICIWIGIESYKIQADSLEHARELANILQIKFDSLYIDKIPNNIKYKVWDFEELKNEIDNNKKKKK